MRVAFLIAGNFVRENRWPVIILLVWGLASGVAGVVLAGRPDDDALFFLKQQAMYSVFFTVFLAASSLHNQRRNRKILAVLSKGIERYEYLAGIVLGYSGVALLYAFCLGITGALTFHRAGASVWLVLPLMIMLLIASVLAGTVALFFSTFMPPLFALAATSVVLGTSAVLSGVLGKNISALVPFYQLLACVSEFSFGAGNTAPWAAGFWAVLETIAFWIAGSWIFERKDVAVAVE
ncbi:MAG TPA: hypothetical protein VG897_11820 [Terriglobales bacterium]|nr:hypothetical protein [Terriglobales bacterium]